MLCMYVCVCVSNAAHSLVMLHTVSTTHYVCITQYMYLRDRVCVCMCVYVCGWVGVGVCVRVCLWCCSYKPQTFFHSMILHFAHNVALSVEDTNLVITRVGQNHIYTVYIRYFWQGNYKMYCHIRCIYTVLANPSNNAVCTPEMEFDHFRCFIMLLHQSSTRIGARASKCASAWLMIYRLSGCLNLVSQHLATNSKQCALSTQTKESICMGS